MIKEDRHTGRPALLLALLFAPLILYGDRSLSITTDKTVYTLGETVTMTISIENEKCKEHSHYLDIYIYDSSNLLVDTILGHTQEYGLSPSQFPYKVRYNPPKVETYTVKLYVFHGYYWGAKYVPLEDTATFQVRETVSPTQITTQTITQTITQTLTSASVTTITSTTTFSLTTTQILTVKIDWITPVSEVARIVYRFLLHLNPILLIVVGALVLLSAKLARFVGIVAIILGVILLVLPYLV